MTVQFNKKKDALLINGYLTEVQDFLQSMMDGSEQNKCSIIIYDEETEEKFLNKTKEKQNKC